MHVYALLRAHKDAIASAAASTSSDSNAEAQHKDGQQHAQVASSAHLPISLVTGVQSVSRNQKMDVHRRSGSASGGAFVWDPAHKPPLRRGSSHASVTSASAPQTAAVAPEAGSSGSTIESPQKGSSNRRASSQTRATFEARSATPVDAGASGLNPPQSPMSVAHHPASAFAAAGFTGLGQTATSVTPSVSSATHNGSSTAGTSTTMQPPQQTPSRRSSFSGSVIDAGSPQTSVTSMAPSAGPCGPSHSAASHSQPIITAGGTTPLSGSQAHPGPPSSGASTRAAATPARGHRETTPAHHATPTLPPASAIPTGSVSAASRGRSPSPFPPLPAIRAPPSPRERMHGSLYGGPGQMAKASMRLYGDENFSGFFRRLAFSPDGAFLATPAGQFDAPVLPPSPADAHASGSTPARKTSAAPEESLDPRASGSPQHTSAISRTPSVGPKSGPGQSTSAQATSQQQAGSKSTVYLYARGSLHRNNAPIAHLPGHKTATLVIRFSPILYKLRSSSSATSAKASDAAGRAPHPTIPLEAGKQNSISLPDATASSSSGSTEGVGMFALPYRMVFAVATQDSVWIYDTQQSGPICCFSNMHYASFTDLTWSPDGQTLMMSSTDGYCSVVVFDYCELGVPYAYGEQPSLRALPAPSATSHASTASKAQPASPRSKASQLLPPGAAPVVEAEPSVQPQEPAAPAVQPSGLATAAASSSTDEPKPKKRRIAPTLVTN